MTTLSSRQRLIKTLNHEEPDRVPYDLAGCHLTGIANVAYQNLRVYLGLAPDEPQWADVVQQIVIPGDDLMEKLGVDTRGLYPLTSHNWDVMEKLEDAGEAWAYPDEWGMTHHFPKENGLWFSIVEFPMSAGLSADVIDAHQWPDAANPARVAGLRAQALAFRNAGKAVVLKGLCAGLFEMSQRLRGMENALMDPLLDPTTFDLLIGKLTDLKIAFWQMALAELGDVVDVVVEADDYGTQASMHMSPDQFRTVFKPHIARLIAAIKQAAPAAKIFFHSCGSVRPILPDFIEMGIDILNPVHIGAAGMEPEGLKRDFGDDIVFWGGGADTQNVLPYGNPDQVREHVRRNIEALAPGGGFVFNPVHNIQPEVPPENIMAMWETLQEFGEY